MCVNDRLKSRLDGARKLDQSSIASIASSPLHRPPRRHGDLYIDRGTVVIQIGARPRFSRAKDGGRNHRKTLCDLRRSVRCRVTRSAELDGYGAQFVLLSAVDTEPTGIEKLNP